MAISKEEYRANRFPELVNSVVDSKKDAERTSFGIGANREIISIAAGQHIVEELRSKELAIVPEATAKPKPHYSAFFTHQPQPVAQHPEKEQEKKETPTKKT